MQCSPTADQPIVARGRSIIEANHLELDTLTGRQGNRNGSTARRGGSEVGFVDFVGGSEVGHSGEEKGDVGGVKGE